MAAISYRYKHLVLLIGVLGLALQVSAFTIDISAHYLNTTSYNTPINISCEAIDQQRLQRTPVELFACQFMLTRSDNKNAGIVDVSDDSAGNKSKGVLSYGARLQDGQCWMMVETRSNPRVVGCRVRKTDGRWQYQQTLISWMGPGTISYTIEPSAVIAEPGSSVTFLGLADTSLNECLFRMSSKAVDNIYFYGGHFSDSTAHYEYHGTGLHTNQCGMTVHLLGSGDSGFLFSRVGKEGVKEIWSFASLTVISPPDSHVMTVTKSILVNGDILNASCHVTNSRPAAHITWYLGGHVVRSDDVNEMEPEEKWLWLHDLQSVSQTLLLPVTTDYHGMMLMCVASHVALPGGKSYSQQYVIHVNKKYIDIFD